MTSEQALAAVIAYFGGSKSELARRLKGATPQAVAQWSIIPAARVLEVEHLVGGKITRYDMRPDIFGQKPRLGRASHVG